MVYNLILVLAQGVSTVGTYSTLPACQAQLDQFKSQDIKAACVQQQSPEEAMKQAQAMFKAFQAIIPQQ